MTLPPPRNVIVTACNPAFLPQALHTVRGLRTAGKWEGDIVIFSDVDLTAPSSPDSSSRPLVAELQQQWRVQFKCFAPRDVSGIYAAHAARPLVTAHPPTLAKTFQWHKLCLMDPWFCSWDGVLWVDAGMTVLSDVAPLWEILRRYPSRVIAHDDGYPTMEWTLATQFCPLADPPLYRALAARFNLAAGHFQTGMLLYRPAALPSRALDDAWALANEFPIARTNEQAICNLVLGGLWLPLPVEWKGRRTYDFTDRGGHAREDYVMLKQ